MRGLLVIDVQNGICYPNDGQILYQSEKMIEAINQRIDEYRERKAPIIFIRHVDQDLIKGSVEGDFVSDLHFQSEDIVVEKTTPDAFYQTDLKQVLDDFRCRELELTGVQTEYCMDTTIKVAFDRGYHLSMSRHLVTSTVDNAWMTAAETISYYQKIWESHFITFS